ncbi:MAG TPA: sulfurtransferase TusA family protein [Candidatus Wujingus californicus]|uniref:sulfurtransferase TusA family protein n=1 Tax=Candidatus Wujingus californicus TaxID=3367618 RepID=UPI0008AD70BA|nr:sulfurtransferase TusA family protein [Planctomycetota bacterium]MDO8130295.1 sulfurtransferase TusA family protein [Candidatus Brocadiales bacterium]OHB96852.1 MAG: SirA family protein [Planctomycetes bacterium RIFCSPLOWO2_12_38_17]
MNADDILDCYGLMCPMPIFRTANKIKEVGIGKVLEVIATDEGIKKDIVSWCNTTGNDLMGIEEADGEIHVFIKRRN